jgi:phosphoribosylanthranilate isomerase
VKIKICGISREEDIEYINEARPDYTGFVFAESRRKVTPAQAARLRQRLAEEIAAVGVFVDAPIDEIVGLCRDGIISLVQLHGTENDAYIERLKEVDSSVPVIKVIKSMELERIVLTEASKTIAPGTDYYLIDSGAGSGKTFDWDLMRTGTPCASWLESSGKRWFLAGGITPENIEQAMELNPFAIDVSGGAETNGIKDRNKVVQLTAMVRSLKEKTV